MKNQILRSVFFEADGRKFELTTYHVGFEPGGRTIVGYRFGEVGKPYLFEREDFSPGMGMAADGDLVIGSLLSFLTLMPGDTDEEYFDGYTPEQRAWCEDRACEELTLHVEYLENGDAVDAGESPGLYVHPEHPEDSPWQVFTEQDPR